MWNDSRFQILSLDGGGIRGVFTAAILAAVEDDYDVRVADHFDLIAGTSTGGIIALALGLGLRPHEVLQFYLTQGPSIFGGWEGGRSARHFVRSKYSLSPLQEALQQVFGTKTFGDSHTRLVVPSFNLGANDVYVFRTPHLSHLRRDYRVPAWKVGLATSAAPTYFPACTAVDGLRLVDGGVWANNPSLVALVEAVGPLSVPQDSVSLLSVGTVATFKTFSKELDNAGKIRWASEVADLILDATSTGVSNQVRFLLGEERYLRVNAVGAREETTLDGIRGVEALIAKARHASRRELPSIADKFLSHRAAQYTPLHQLGS